MDEEERLSKILLGEKEGSMEHAMSLGPWGKTDQEINKQTGGTKDAVQQVRGVMRA